MLKKKKRKSQPPSTNKLFFEFSVKVFEILINYSRRIFWGCNSSRILNFSLSNDLVTQLKTNGYPIFSLSHQIELNIRKRPENLSVSLQITNLIYLNCNRIKLEVHRLNKININDRKKYLQFLRQCYTEKHRQETSLLTRIFNVVILS